MPMTIKLTDKHQNIVTRWCIINSQHLARFCIEHCHSEKNLTNFEETVYMHAQLTSGQVYNNDQGSWEVVK